MKQQTAYTRKQQKINGTVENNKKLANNFAGLIKISLGPDVSRLPRVGPRYHSL
jgi:hypothetical protein